MSTNRWFVCSRARLRAEDVEQFMELSRLFAARTRAEPGCIAMDYSIDALDPTIVNVYSVWESREAQEARTKLPSWADRLREIEPFAIEIQEAKYYEARLASDGPAHK